VVKTISAVAREACADDSADGGKRFTKELEIQWKNTNYILSVMSAKVKNWVYK
jgi:hypothetical protein